VVTGAVTVEEARGFVDLPTVLLLFSMMVLSAQLRLGGFYSRLVRRLGNPRVTPGRLLASVIFVGGGLSAVFTNDVIALVMTPLLVTACLRKGVSPVPYLLALACAVNVGSAATLVGNPQNILIGQTLDVSFGGYLLIALLPTLSGLGLIWLLTLRIWKVELFSRSDERDALPPADEMPFDSWQTGKGLSLAALVLMLFLFSSLPREAVGMGAAALILLNRRFHTRDVLGLVDWELVVLFLGLFVVNGALLETGAAHQALLWLQNAGLDLSRPVPLFLVTPVLSLAVSNVPATMLLLPAASAGAGGAVLALSSTLAGNALIIGSVANFIVLEQGARMGVSFTWRQHAALGIPVTLGTLALAAGALWVGAVLG
jgi:Na+/H+ antiporter NhaD/arsenite permease-like protein